MANFMFLVLFLIVHGCSCYENSTNLCGKCECIEEPGKYTLNCRSRGFQDVIANWPPHNNTLVASFSNNSITTLKRLPTSDMVLEVVFSHCGIKNIADGAFEGIRFVQYVDLSYNLLQAEEIASEKFKGLYNKTQYEPIAIKHLNLAYNQIHSLPKDVFEHMLDLESLNLEGNQISRLDSQTQGALSTLKNIQSLNLANNGLTELVGNAIQNMSNLVEINLSSNDLDDIPVSLNYVGQHLETLILDNNPIFELNDDAFVGLTGIKHLSMNNLSSNLQFIPSNAFSSLKNLNTLKLSRNINLRAINKDAFNADQKIEQVYLNNNSLEHIHPMLMNWTHLTVLEIYDNPLECTCDLYNITQKLTAEIKRNREGPSCVVPVSNNVLQIYQLQDTFCDIAYRPLHIAHVEQHFNILRVVLIICANILCILTLVAATILYLRWRRHRMQLNYPFASQVIYNPLNAYARTT